MARADIATEGAGPAGFASVAGAGPRGMVTLRGDLTSPVLARAVAAVTGTGVPARRRIEVAGDRAVAWMSPDELLVLVPRAEAGAAVAALEQALSGEHHFVVDVFDARAAFTIRGPGAQGVLMKLCPVDFATLAEGEIRRSRAGQVAAAVWRSGADEFTLVSFRSVAGYVMALLEFSARPGAEPFPA